MAGDFIVPSRKLSGGGFQHVVGSLNNLVGDLQIVAGANVTLSVSGSKLTLSTPSWGSITSLDVAVPSNLLTSTGGPITSNGVITIGLASQAAGTIFAGPTAGISAPAFRALVSGDLPIHDLLATHSVTGLTPNTFMKAISPSSMAFAAILSTDLPAHTHTASDVISGALALARGGTGASLPTPASDKLLMFDSGLASSTWVTLGTNLSVTSGELDVAKNGLNLSSASNIYDVNGDCWILGNATYSGVSFERSSIGKTAFGLYLGGTNNFPSSSVQGAALWVAAPAYNPIDASFNTTDGWNIGWQLTPTRDFILGGDGLVVYGLGGFSPYLRLVHNGAFSSTYSGIVTNLSTDFSTRDNSSTQSWFAGIVADSFAVARLAGGASITQGNLTELLAIDNAGNTTVSGALTASGGVQLPHALHADATDVMLTAANTFYDGPGVSLAAGIWYVTATVTLTGAASSTNDTIKLWDGSTNILASTQRSTVSTGEIGTVTVSGITTLASATTIKVSVATTDTSANHRIKAAATANAAGNTASTIAAMRVG